MDEQYRSIVEYVLRPEIVALIFAVALGVSLLSALVFYAKRSTFVLASGMIFFMPAGLLLMLLEKRAWRPVWKWLYVSAAVVACLLHLQNFRSDWLHPLDAWVLSIWTGALLAAGFFGLHWRHLFVRRKADAPEIGNRVGSLLAEKEIPEGQLLSSADGATGLGIDKARKIIYLVRPLKSFPQEITYKDLLAVLLVEDDIVLEESTSQSLRHMDEFKRSNFWPGSKSEQPPGKRVKHLELRIAVADFLEPTLIVQLLPKPQSRGSRDHTQHLAQSRAWFLSLQRLMNTAGVKAGPGEPPRVGPSYGANRVNLEP